MLGVAEARSHMQLLIRGDCFIKFASSSLACPRAAETAPKPLVGSTPCLRVSRFLLSCLEAWRANRRCLAACLALHCSIFPAAWARQKSLAASMSQKFLIASPRARVLWSPLLGSMCPCALDRFVWKLRGRAPLMGSMSHLASAAVVGAGPG